MVNFGEKIVNYANLKDHIPIWCWLRYAEGKKLIKFYAHKPNNIFDVTLTDLDEIQKIYSENIVYGKDGFVSDKRAISDFYLWIKSECSRVLSVFNELNEQKRWYNDVEAMEFLDWNLEGFRKILKKFKKQTGLSFECEVFNEIINEFTPYLKEYYQHIDKSRITHFRETTQLIIKEVTDLDNEMHKIDDEDDDEDDDKKPTFLGQCILGKTLLYWLSLIFTSCMFILCFGVSIVAIKFINNEYSIVQPYYIAMLLTGMFPINFLLWWYLRKRNQSLHPTLRVKEPKITIHLLKKYCFLGIVDGTRMVMLSLALNWLPGSTYMVLKSSSIIFTLVLSLIVLKKSLNLFHYASISVLCGAIYLLASGKNDDTEDGISSSKYTAGFILAIGSALANSINSVLAAVLLKDVKKQKNALTLAQTASFNGLFAFIVVVIAMLISQEYQNWPDAFNSDTLPSSSDVILFIFMSFLIGLTKQIGYFFKFALVAITSALYSDVVAMIRRLLVIISVVLAFNESFGWRKQIATICFVVALGLYTNGGIIDKKKNKLKNEIQNEQSTTELSSVQINK